MKLKTLLAIVGIALFGAACSDTQYPGSGEECAPEDPVMELSVQQCAQAA